MESRYIYLCSVSIDDQLFAATIPAQAVSPGDFVVLNNGYRGTVIRVVLIDSEGLDFAIFKDFVEVHEIIDVYSYIWSKPKESEES